ncbi:hypothetical protein [Streptacidiphilus sp. EB103A]|uniref:hypothetical protein n=1 Tax=Streptacidiphilus sp. EB103A TaxID=3156275 RepID=UPI0035113EFB
MSVLSSSLFMVLMLAALLLGRGTLHLRSGELVGVLAAWGWLSVHLAAPMLASGAVLGGLGVALFAAPAAAARQWPWQVSQLNVRALGAWPLPFGAATLLDLLGLGLSGFGISALLSGPEPARLPAKRA